MQRKVRNGGESSNGLELGLRGQDVNWMIRHFLVQGARVQIKTVTTKARGLSNSLVSP